MGQKWFITGGAGFIGRHINARLGDAGQVNVDLRDWVEVPGRVVCDIRNKELLRQHVGDCDAILHLAASHYDFETEFTSTNVDGMRNLLELATDRNINTFVFYSSVAVYGTHAKPVDESGTKQPDNEYGRTKLQAEGLLTEWAKEGTGRKVLIIRPAVVFGPHNYGNLFYLTRQIDAGRNIRIGNSPTVKSIAYVENLVDATFHLVSRMAPGIEICNYSDEPHLNGFEISDAIAEALGRTRAIPIPMSLALAVGWVFDRLSALTGQQYPISMYRVRKLNTATHFVASRIRETGFRPRYDTRQGLGATTRWYMQNRDVWTSEYEALRTLFLNHFGIRLN
jgi:nucleoside-diphosphate-sugar epimerase